MQRLEFSGAVRYIIIIIIIIIIRRLKVNITYLENHYVTIHISWTVNNRSSSEVLHYLTGEHTASGEV
jgi:hypothetical protein